MLCMQSQDCKRLLGGCQHSLPDGILVITLVFKVSSLSSFWPSHVHYFVITLALILSSLSSKDCWVVANIVCQMATQLNHPCHHFGQHIVITFGPHIILTSLLSLFLLFCHHCHHYSHYFVIFDITILVILSSLSPSSPDHHRPC